MARRRWSLLVVPDGNPGQRRFRPSRDVVRAGIAGMLLLVAAVSSAATRMVADRAPTLSEMKLARENKALRDELDDMRTRLDTLRGSLESLSDMDAYYRLLAGLDPISEDVRRVGIGGPGMETVEDNPLWGLNDGDARQTFSLSTELNTLIRRARLLTHSWREAEDTMRFKYDRLASTPSILPTQGYISSAFSRSRWHPILGRRRPHLGLDIVAPRGSPIVAAANGRVRFAGRAGEYGLMIEIDHGHGYVTRYAHASKLLVRKGQPVERGDLIGLVGETGLAVGPHVHYEVLVNNHPANPRRFIIQTTVVPD